MKGIETMMVISKTGNQTRFKTCLMCGGPIRKFNSDYRLRSLKTAWLKQKYCSRKCTTESRNVYKAMRLFSIMVDNLLAGKIDEKPIPVINIRIK